MIVTEQKNENKIITMRVNKNKQLRRESIKIK